MAAKREDLEKAIKLADSLVDALTSFPLKLVVPKRLRKGAQFIADVLRDVEPLVR